MCWAVASASKLRQDFVGGRLGCGRGGSRGIENEEHAQWKMDVMEVTSWPVDYFVLDVTVLTSLLFHTTFGLCR